MKRRCRAQLRGASAPTANRGARTIDVEFDELVLDEEKAGGRLMFRLAEAIGGPRPVPHR